MMCTSKLAKSLNLHICLCKVCFEVKAKIEHDRTGKRFFFLIFLYEWMFR
jgi:hypothetical protein